MKIWPFGTSTPTHGPHRRIEMARGVWGLAELTAPRIALARTGGDPEHTPSRVVMRILGARHLTQAVLSGRSPTPAVLAMGVWVDGVHALCDVGLALARPQYARPALIDALVATGWAGFGTHDLLTGTRGEGEELRSRLGRDVLGVVPGGAALLQLADRADA